MGSEIPAEGIMPGNGNASPQSELRGDALFLFSEGVNIAGQATVVLTGFFNLSQNFLSCIYNRPISHCLFLTVAVLLCLFLPP